MSGMLSRTSRRGLIRFKEGVCLRWDAPAVRHLVETLAALSEQDEVQAAVLDGLLTITSGNDSAHSLQPLSRHYTDEAIDVRAHNVRKEQREWFRERYERALNAAFAAPVFRVLHEYLGTSHEHFHAQVRQGQAFPRLGREPRVGE